MHSSELLKGTLKTIVMKVLKEEGRMYGYELVQRVKELSDGSIQITEGALYPLLHALELSGELSTEKEMIGKRVRKYYQLTPSGKSATKSRIKELEAFMETLKIILEWDKKQLHA
jgi:DNA-binding PadR family transcriptional regulator